MAGKRVLLITPNPRAEWQGIMPHIGQAYIAQTLLENGIEYEVVDMNLGYGLKEIEHRIERFKPDLVGISLIAFEYKRFYQLLTDIKRFAPNVGIVAGGPHATILRQQLLEECPAIDYGVVYEGERTLTELSQGQIPVHEIKGVLYRDNGIVKYTGDREFTADLDQIPWPTYQGFELDRYVGETTIYSSRGCPHKCTFCANRIISPLYRPRSPKHVVDEMEHWYSRGRRQFNFDDDNFNHVRNRVFEICDEIERRGLKKLFLRCSNGIRADRVDREMLARMWEVGFRYIAYGVDGGNNKILEIVKKGETIESIEQAIAASCDLGYGVKLLFVVGTPYETWEDVEDKVRLAKRYPIQEVHFYNTVPFPGTELYEWVKENDLFLVDPRIYLNDTSGLTTVPVFETPELPRAERVKLFKYLGSVRRQVHRNAVRRALKNYGPLGTLASYVVINRPVEKYFYQSVLVRRAIESVRYQLAVSK